MAFFTDKELWRHHYYNYSLQKNKEIQNLLCFLLQLSNKRRHVLCHEFQFFVLFCMDLLQPANSLHQRSLLWVQLLSLPLGSSDDLHGLRLWHLTQEADKTLVRYRLQNYKTYLTERGLYNLTMGEGWSVWAPKLRVKVHVLQGNVLEISDSEWKIN